MVEDETVLFLELEKELKALGFNEVHHASGVEDAFSALERLRLDLAVLDVNLAGEPVFPVAHRLAEAKVPFFFVTGFQPESIPEEWASSVVIQKPVDPSRLRSAVTAALDAARGSHAAVAAQASGKGATEHFTASGDRSHLPGGTK